ncbi:UNKNOWN [Stylonychia lemnae]|uniref:Uncharacterized protein n=1 Tax=Stylonychia lemnae TaxID=5949 RepID=A0A078AK16_STYLE|nr:UNKNOWN [Stylonychia lemnae]|eukprot:CDW81148.1 UNKNOWN [Stylonychia lemnae]
MNQTRNQVLPQINSHGNSSEQQYLNENLFDLRDKNKEGRKQKNYEVMDLIYHKQKKKKKQEEYNIAQFMKKNQVEEYQIDIQRAEIQRICKEYGIQYNQKNFPYREKIRQICQDISVFYQYKRDQRDILDSSVLKNPEYLKRKKEEFIKMKTLFTAEYLGIDKLTSSERELFLKLQEEKLREQEDSSEENANALRNKSRLDNTKDPSKNDSYLKKVQINESQQIIELPVISINHKLSKSIVANGSNQHSKDQENTFISLMKKSEELYSVPDGTEPLSTIKLKQQHIKNQSSLDTQGSRNLNLAPIIHRKKLRDRVQKANISILDNEFLNQSITESNLDGSQRFKQSILSKKVQRKFDQSFDNNNDKVKASGLLTTTSSALKQMMYQSFFTPNKTKMNNKLGRATSKSPEENFGAENIPQTEFKPTGMRLKFKEETPKLNDTNIKELISKYPSPSKRSVLERQQTDSLRTRQRKQLQSIIRNVDRNEIDRKNDEQKLLQDMLVQNIKEEQFLKTLDKLKEIDFADSSVMETLFEYKTRDEEDQIEQAHEVAKEYHSGKLDPLNAIKLEKKRRTQNTKKF